jgi:hypothetical protein
LLHSWLVVHRPGFAPQAIRFPNKEEAQASAQGHELLHPEWPVHVVDAETQRDAVIAFKAWEASR